MTNEELKSIVNGLTQGLEFPENKQFLEVVVPAGALHSFAKQLKETKETAFDYLISLTGVDYDTNMGITYHLESTTFHHCLVMKVFTNDRENPEVDSVFDIWTTAEFQEREAFDLLGIKFTHHPDLRRIFLDDNWVGYPLRKDYKDDEKLIER
jgi:NADH-quinone oxidoreductase subunit C